MRPRSATEQPKDCASRAAMTWMQRLRRVYDKDVSVCPDCGGRLKVLAVITDPQVIISILAHQAQASSPSTTGGGVSAVSFISNRSGAHLAKQLSAQLRGCKDSAPSLSVRHPRRCQPASPCDSTPRSPRRRRGVRAQGDTRGSTRIAGLNFLFAYPADYRDLRPLSRGRGKSLARSRLTGSGFAGRNFKFRLAYKPSRASPS